MRLHGVHKHSSRPLDEHQKALKTTQTAVNKMIGERDAGLACVTCDSMKASSAGHFRTSTNVATRFHPFNLHLQCRSCNEFNGGMTYEHALAVDRIHGKGWAAFLEKLARKPEIWTIMELQLLRAAARMGPRVFNQVYFELRPNHCFISPSYSP
jgi:hypothetical protein